MTEDVARAWAFMQRGDAAGETQEPTPLGTAVRDGRVPLRHDSNYLFLERAATGDEIADELRRLRLPIAIVPDEALLPSGTGGAEVAHRGVVMVHDGPVARPPLAAVQIAREALEPLRRAFVLSQPWGSAEVADQLLTAKALIPAPVTARFFASLVDGKPVAYTDLYLDPPDAQIEDVGTAPEHRGRGHATAVVLTALAEAREAGAEFVFLVAAAEDWPKDWYARLGFETAGRYVKLRAPTEAP